MNFNLPKIYRTQVIEGVSIPGIIKNGGHFFFTDFSVYEDGRVACWNFQDFDHFKQDVQRGWVSVQIPDGKSISIHSLGAWEITKSKWLYSKDSFVAYVWSLVKHLNPHLINLYSYTEKKVNGITVGEMGKGSIYKEKKRSQVDLFPKKVKGKGMNLFLKDDNQEYHLVRLDIYDAQSIVVNRLEKPFEVSFSYLEKLVFEGKIVTRLPIGAQVHILGLGSFQINEEQYAAKISEKLLEVEDIIRVLKGEPSTLELCRQIYDQYMKKPSEALRQQLKEAYEKIPEHERMYVGDMDVKDTAVRMIIYGKQEIENWSHYQVARELGEELPHIQIPDPEDE